MRIKFFHITTICLILLITSGCSGLRDDKDRFVNPLSTTKFVSDEELGSAELRVVSTTPEAGYIGPPVKIGVKFNEPVKRETIEKNIYVHDVENRRIKCKYFFYELLDSPETLVEVIPLESINSSKKYFITINKECESRLGEKMKESIKIPFIFSNKIIP